MNSGASGRHLHCPRPSHQPNVRLSRQGSPSQLHQCAAPDFLLGDSPPHRPPLLTSLGSCLTTKIVKSMSRKRGQCFPQTLLLPGIIFLPPSRKTPSPSRLLPVLAFSELIMHAGRLAQQDTSSLGLSSHCQKSSGSPEILPTSLSSPSQNPKYT